MLSRPPLSPGAAAWCAFCTRLLRRTFVTGTRIHAVRVALAMASSFLVTTGIDLPHGVWASVSLLVVIGGLQHYGNIRKKATERAFSTALGAGFVLFLILVDIAFGQLWLFFLLMSIIVGGCAYYAIGKAGYIALLTAIRW